MSVDTQPNDLFNAAKSYKAIWAEALIKENGFNPNEADEQGNTPLFYAADVGDIVAIGYSLSPNALDTIKVLMQNGANPDIRNNSGQTVIEIARSLVTAGGEFNTWLTLASILYGNNTPLFKERIAKAEKDYNPKKLFESEDIISQSEFPEFPTSKPSEKSKTKSSVKKIGKDSIVIASSLSLTFLLSPVLTLFFTWADLFALSSDWLWIDNSIVGISLLLSVAAIWAIRLEKDFARLSLFFLLPLFGCLFYFGLILSFFQPDVRYRIKKHYYSKSAFQYGLDNPWVQRGYYEDFLEGETGKKLRADEELLIQLALGLQPDQGISEIGKGFGAQDYAKQGFTVYVSFREMNLSDREIFSRPEARGLLYALAMAEANPDLLDISKIPEEFSSKYLRFREGEKFKLGILDDSKMNFFYDLIVNNIAESSLIETELAIFILTQIPVDLEDKSFEAILNHWIEYKKIYENELRYLMALRKEIRQQFLKSANPNKALKINLGNSHSRVNWERVKPLLTSAGFAVEMGDDIKISFQVDAEFLKDKKVYRTKAVQKIRTVNRTVNNYGSPQRYTTETITEKYTDYVSDGFDILPMYVYTYAFPNFRPKEKEVKLCGMLADCYLSSEKETVLPIEAYSRGETWLYALPQKLVCPEGCNGR